MLNSNLLRQYLLKAYWFFIEGVGENTDLYQQIAEKDHYLMLAAEAGKVLLEKNQELTHHYESLQDDYLRKIEVRHV